MRDTQKQKREKNDKKRVFPAEVEHRRELNKWGSKGLTPPPRPGGMVPLAMMETRVGRKKGDTFCGDDVWKIRRRAERAPQWLGDGKRGMEIDNGPIKDGRGERDWGSLPRLHGNRELREFEYDLFSGICMVSFLD